MKDSWYRKFNDHSLNSRTYHKKDSVNIRAKIKQDTADEVKRLNEEQIRDSLCMPSTEYCYDPDCGLDAPVCEKCKKASDLMEEHRQINDFLSSDKGGGIW